MAFVIAGIVAVLYALVRFLEMRFILKETLPLKHIIRDTMIVYLCVVGGLFIHDQLKDSYPSATPPEVMVGEAGF